MGVAGCLGAVVIGRLKEGLFSGGGGLFRGLFRAGQWRVHHRHKNRQAGGGGGGRWFRPKYFSLSLSRFLFSFSLLLYISLHSFHLSFSKKK